MPRKGPCFLCGRLAGTRCGFCNKIFYCGSAHMSLHRQNDYCFPYRINWKPMGGGAEGLVTVRDIEPLELLLFESSLVQGICAGKTWSPSAKVCSACLQVEGSGRPMMACGLCGLDVCSDQCQVGLNHEPECKIFRYARGRRELREEPGILINLIMPLRLIRMRLMNAKAYGKVQPLLESVQQQQQQQRPGDLQWLAKRSKWINLLQSSLSQVSEEMVTWAVDLMQMRVLPTTSCHAGLFFPTFSLISHSCLPNAKFVVLPNHRVAVQAQTAIPQGQEIRVSLVPTLEPTWKRAAILYRDFRLECRCLRCTDPTELSTYLGALKCPKCEAGAILPERPTSPSSDWTCRVHKGIRVSARNAQQLALDLQTHLYSQGLVTTIDKLTQLIQQLEEFLHPQHGLVMVAKRSLINCYSQMRADQVGETEHHVLRDLCLEQLDVLGSLDSGYPDWKGNILKHLSTAELNLARLRFESGAIQRPDLMISVKRAMAMVQEGVRCKSCVKVDRSVSAGSSEHLSFYDLVNELSSDPDTADKSSCHSDLSQASLSTL